MNTENTPKDPVGSAANGTGAPRKMSFEEELDRYGTLCHPNVGVSMMPLLQENRDLMVIKKKGEERCRRLDAVLFKRTAVNGRDAYVLHRILKVNPDGTYWIIGDNCISGETVAEENVLGVLTAVVRDGKTVPVTSRKYLAYVNLWCRPYRFRVFLLRLRGRVSAVKRKLSKTLSPKKH